MKPKFIGGGLVILAALGYMIYAGVTQSAVYFVTPSELRASPVTGKAYRLGGSDGMHGRSTWPSLSPMARPASPSVTRARRPTSSVKAAAPSWRGP